MIWGYPYFWKHPHVSPLVVYPFFFGRFCLATFLGGASVLLCGRKKTLGSVIVTLFHGSRGWISLMGEAYGMSTVFTRFRMSFHQWLHGSFHVLRGRVHHRVSLHSGATTCRKHQEGLHPCLVSGCPTENSHHLWYPWDFLLCEWRWRYRWRKSPP